MTINIGEEFKRKWVNLKKQKETNQIFNIMTEKMLVLDMQLNQNLFKNCL